MKKQSNLITEHASKKFLIGLSVMAAGLIFFLSSGFVFGDESRSKVQQTSLNKKLNLQGSGDMRIEEWTYNPKKKLMVVSLYLDKSTALMDDKLTFVAQEKSNPKRKIPTTIEYQDENRYVISIQDVSSSFEVMALNINKQEEGSDLLTQETQNQTEKNEKDTQLARIYTDQRKVQRDSELRIQTEQEYEIDFLSQEINQTKKTAKEKEERIQKIDQLLTEIDQEIVELESEILYETEEEKKQTSARIDQLENEIDKLNQEAVDEETSIQRLQEKRAMLEEKREMIAD